MTYRLHGNGILSGAKMPETARTWLLMFVLNIPVYVLWGWVLFRTWGDFWEAIVFWLKPEL